MQVSLCSKCTGNSVVLMPPDSRYLAGSVWAFLPHRAPYGSAELQHPAITENIVWDKQVQPGQRQNRAMQLQAGCPFSEQTTHDDPQGIALQVSLLAPPASAC